MVPLWELIWREFGEKGDIYSAICAQLEKGRRPVHKQQWQSSLMRPDATTVNARRGGVGQRYKLYIRARCGHGLLLLDVPKADRRFSMVQWTRYNQLADTHAKVCRSSVSDHLIPAILPGKMGEQDQATSDESQRPRCMITKIWVCYIERSRLIPGYVWGMALSF